MEPVIINGKHGFSINRYSQAINGFANLIEHPIIHIFYKGDQARKEMFLIVIL